MAWRMSPLKTTVGMSEGSGKQGRTQRGKSALHRAHPPRRSDRPARARALQACIDQSNIEASLAVLPIFLAGCKYLLILPGHTYATRLW